MNREHRIATRPIGSRIVRYVGSVAAAWTTVASIGIPAGTVSCELDDDCAEFMADVRDDFYICGAEFGTNRIHWLELSLEPGQQVLDVSLPVCGTDWPCSTVRVYGYADTSGCLANPGAPVGEFFELEPYSVELGPEVGGGEREFTTVEFSLDTSTCGCNDLGETSYELGGVVYISGDPCDQDAFGSCPVGRIITVNVELPHCAPEGTPPPDR